MNFSPDQFPQKQEAPANEGVDFVFEHHSELSSIGTKEQYSQYIETIFPESKVRAIHYHGSPNEIEKFISPEDSGYAKQETTTTGVAGIYFTDKKHIAEVYKDIQNPESGNGYLYPVVLNVKKPLIVGNHILDGQGDTGLGVSALWHIQKNALASIRNAGFDAIQAGEYATRTSPMGENTEIAILDSNQIHILGSREDIEKFKEFVAQKV